MIARFGPHWHMWNDGFSLWPGTLLSVLSTLLLVALSLMLLWTLLQWIIPYIWPRIEHMFFVPTTHLSPLEILRRRYAEGAIDTDTFEMMRERLEASYPRNERHEFL
ncbi:MAG TPA: SHOCT domain-containing protein [Ktedonosporobacter sp.]|nr:SHOCT domain-containing protein [Ktedonosporobacter sp.]